MDHFGRPEVDHFGRPRVDHIARPLKILELHQIVRRYSELRITRPRCDARLVASLAQQGQCTPLLVCASAVSEEPSRYVLIDGYRRVRALEQLGRDTAVATSTELPEDEALLWHHQMESRGRRTALEEAWLLHELEQAYGMSRDGLAEKLVRSKSWISRRLALVEVLPESVQQLVRQGALCAYAAQKYLVPLARANPGDCEALAAGLAERQVSTRAARQLYIAWRDGDSEQRQRLIHQPHLFIAAMRARDAEPSSGDALHRAAMTGALCVESDAQLTVALEQLTALAGCICRSLERRDATVTPAPELELAWSRAQTSLTAAAQQLEEAAHAGQ